MYAFKRKLLFNPIFEIFKGIFFPLGFLVRKYVIKFVLKCWILTDN